MFFPILFPFIGAGAGVGSKPKTHGPTVLTIAAVGAAAVLGAVGYKLGFGLALPALVFCTVAWCAGWIWLASACMDHGMSESGFNAALYNSVAVVSIFIAILSAVAAMMGVVWWAGGLS